MRRAAWVVVGLGAAALLIALLVGVLANGGGRSSLADAVAERVGELLDARVSIGALRGPLYPELEVEDVSVRFASGAELSFERGALRWRIAWRGLAPEVRLRSLELDGLRARGLEAELAALRTADSAVDAPSARLDIPDSLLEWQSARLRDARIELDGGAALLLEAELQGGAADRWPSAGQLSAELTPGKVAGREVAGGALAAELAASGELLVRAHVASPGGNAELRGSLDFAAWRAGSAAPAFSTDGQVSALDLAVWLGDARLRSALAGPFTATSVPGAANALEARVAFAGAAAGARLERIDVQLRSQGSAWSMDAIRIDGAALALRGKANGDGARLARVELEGEVSDLGLLAEYGLAPVDELRGRARVAAQLARASAELPLAGTAEVHASELALAGRELGSLELVARSTGGHALAIERLNMPTLGLARAPGPPVELRLADGVELRSPLVLKLGTGRLSIAGALRGNTLAGARIDVAALDLAALPPALRIAHALGGVLDGSLRADGPLARPTRALELRWTRAAAGELRADALELSASGQGSALRGMALLRAGSGTARARFDLPTLDVLPALLEGRDAPGASANVELASLEARVLAPLVRRWFEPLEGRLDARFALRPGRPHAELELEVHATDAALRTELLPTRGPLRAAKVDVEVSATNAGLHGALRLAQPGEPRLELTLHGAHPAAAGGFARLAERDDNRGELRASDWDARFLAPWLPAVLEDPRGKLTGQVALAGPLADPRWQGELGWSGGSVRAPLVRQTFAPIEASVRFDARKPVELELRAGPPAGALFAHGTLELAGLAPESVALDLEFADLAFARSPQLRADLRGRARLAGPASAPKLTGSLELRDARMTQPDPLDLELAEIRIQGVNSSPDIDSGPTVADRVAVDVQFEFPEGTRLTGQGLDARGSGTLRAVRQPGQPLRWFGSLATERGSRYRLYATRFEIEHARAEFDGASGFDPQIDAEATSQIGPTLVKLGISGRLSKPLLATTSEPDLPQQEILALILLGRTINPREPGEAGKLGLAASQLGSQFALDQLRSRVGSFLPVDELDTGTTAEGDPSIEVGKALRDGVFVRYGRGLGAKSTDEVTVEWEVAPDVRIEGRVTREGDSGADVIWSKDY
jgi:translocation and assembly module TamB